MHTQGTSVLRMAGATFVVLSAWLAGTASAASPYQSEWSRQVLAPGSQPFNNLFRSLASDHLGNVYAGGVTSNDFDGNINAGGNDAFLIKYNSSGDKIWTRLVGGAGSEHVTDVATDDSGSAYITGWTQSDLGGNTNAGNRDGFLTKFDASGNALWTQQIGTVGRDESHSVATDSWGNAYISGRTAGGLDGNVLAGSSDAFLTKYDSTGNKLWTQQLGSIEFDTANAVSVDALGNTYMTGFTAGDLDGQTHAGSNDVFLTKFDTGGNKLWTRQAGTLASDIANAIAVDAAGNSYITGSTGGGIDGHTQAGEDDLFLIRYDTDGQKLWTEHIGTATDDVGYAVSTDAQGNALIGHYTYQGFTPGSFFNEVSLTKFHSSSSLEWTKRIGSSNYTGALSMSMDPSANIFMSGLSNTFLVKLAVPEPTGFLLVASGCLVFLRQRSC